MLQTLKDIFETNSVEAPSGERIPLHSHTSLEQGLFLQRVMQEIKPKKSVEVGLAYGLSTLFILEMHRELQNEPKSHITIEPGPEHWGGVAEHNIEKEGLANFCDYKYDLSDKILPSLYFQNHKIQFAYVDTTKLFDTVLQDFYFIDKLLEVNGVIVFDDCGGNWPGVQKVARYVSTLPHYKIFGGHLKVKKTSKFRMAEKAVTTVLGLLPFKKRVFPAYSFETDEDRGINYYCIAFQKVSKDQRNWDWDKPL